MENKGVDASLEYYKTINKDWNISVRGNFTYNRNKKLYDDQPSANYPYKDVIW
ncbi:TonB-dependent receptor [Bacteroides ovatus]|nr:TonB-dependent receptor [Bacteroides ovatus]MCS3036368.1 TonB-dependent receptor [Bacteroides ovatus]